MPDLPSWKVPTFGRASIVPKSSNTCTHHLSDGPTFDSLESLVCLTSDSLDLLCPSAFESLEWLGFAADKSGPSDWLEVSDLSTSRTFTLRSPAWALFSDISVAARRVLEALEPTPDVAIMSRISV